MNEQIGPRRLLRELKAQAPYYAKLLPELPRLLHAHLQHSAGLPQLQQQVRDLAQAQRKGRRLAALAWCATSFALGLLAMLAAQRAGW